VEIINPIVLLKSWLDHAKKEVSGNWNSMCLSTITQNGFPDSRQLLYKQFNGEKIVFFTNYRSKKARDLECCSNVSIVFFWDSLGRQIRLQGHAQKTTREISEVYFNSRPFDSNIGAILSQQSEEIESYEKFEEKYKSLKEDLAEQELICPEFWGGYEVEITRVEFWESNENRLHKRRTFERVDESWDFKFLSP